MAHLERAQGTDIRQGARSCLFRVSRLSILGTFAMVRGRYSTVYLGTCTLRACVTHMGSLNQECVLCLCGLHGVEDELDGHPVPGATLSLSFCVL